jgi:outer membrane receptor protein involved in Fe transport
MLKYIFLLFFIFSANIASFAETFSGKLLSDENNTPIGTAKILIQETGETFSPNSDGAFQIDIKQLENVSLVVTSLKYQTKKLKINIKDFSKSDLEIKLTPKIYQLDDVVIYSASRQKQKITESPAAVYHQSPAELRTSSRTGQIAQIFQNYSGIDVMQSGASDFIVNTRGFNGGLNRRVLVLQDGRETSMPLLGAQEWNSFSMPLDEFSRVEFVRGPAASLYGANAFNGVMNLTSYAPKEVLGPKSSVLFGDFRTMKTDGRFAQEFGKFSYKLTLGHSERLNWAKSRTNASELEYAGLPLERKAITESDRMTTANYGTLRFDYDFTENTTATAEAGYSRNTNEMFVFGLGRTFVKDVERPYVRLAFNTTDFHFHANYMKRSVPDTMWLMVPGAALLDNSDDLFLEAQYNFNPFKNLGFVFGASQDFQRIRTSGTSIPEDVDATYTGFYGQVDYKILANLDFVTSARVDLASIHETQFSPRFALVYHPIVNHKVRVSAGRSFQRPNYSELYRNTPDAPAFDINTKKPVNFAALQKKVNDTLAQITGTNPNLNFGLNPTNAKAIGNEDLLVEKNLGIEFGYDGIFFDRFRFSAEVYYNQLSDFITNFLPGVNPNIPQWKPYLPENLKQYESMVYGIMTSSLNQRDKARLSNYNGAPTFVVSNTNVGEVNQWGFELNMEYYLTKEIHFELGYSNYQFEVTKSDKTQQLLPNTSPNKYKAGITYLKPESFDFQVNLNYTEGFDWLAGTYVGRVPDYAVLNFSAGYYLIKNLEIGVNVYNVLNRKHYEIFGGTYVPRYTTFKLSYQI